MASDFHLAVFSIDGELTGVRRWDSSELDPKKVQECRQILASNASQGRGSLRAPNDAVGYTYTTHHGAALLTMSVAANIGVSVLLASGSSPSVDRQYMDLFCISVSKASPVATLGSGERFRKMLSLTHRPLGVAVIWGNPQISDNESDVMREFTCHFLGAFFDVNASGVAG